jgi:exonuclease III
MKILSWNCRGLGSPTTVRTLSRLIRIENPQIVFLMETRLKAIEVENVRSRLGFKNVCRWIVVGMVVTVAIP